MIFQNLDNKRASESIGFLPSRVYAERKVGHRLLNKTPRKLTLDWSIEKCCRFSVCAAVVHVFELDFPAS